VKRAAEIGAALLIAGAFARLALAHVLFHIVERRAPGID
jgi:hypothetical protein